MVESKSIEYKTNMYKSVALLVIMLLGSCVGAPRLAVKNECGFTTGYIEEKIDEQEYKLIIYTGVNWSDNQVQNILNHRASKLCASRTANYEMTGGLAYFDGCLKHGNASGEEHWGLLCN